jgi:hypothetical protein
MTKINDVLYIEFYGLLSPISLWLVSCYSSVSPHFMFSARAILFRHALLSIFFA